jgi:histidyl-tRNA synthetase
MRDFLPKDFRKKKYVEDRVRQLFQLYGYDEIQTPTIEYFNVLAAKAGNEIRQRMYVFEDLRGRKLALRPEMTAPVARLLSTKLRSQPKPVRLGYISNCFRYDNPQLGRYREFWQIGFELFGSDRPEADSEIIIVSCHLMKELGFDNPIIKIGNVAILREILGSEGIEEHDQSKIMGLIDNNAEAEVIDLLKRMKIKEKTVEIIEQLFMMKGTNTKNIIKDGKHIVRNFKNAEAGITRIEKVIEYSIDSGVEYPFLVDLGFARGLEYYTGMIYEIYVPAFNIALCGGGRYDNLVELFGGISLPAVGCSMGIDRIVLVMEKEKMFPKTLLSNSGLNRALVIPVNEDYTSQALDVASHLRLVGVSTQVEISGKSVGKALKYADKEGYSHSIIVGPKELEKGSIILRVMKEKLQKEVSLQGLAEEIKSYRRETFKK